MNKRWLYLLLLTGLMPVAMVLASGQGEGAGAGAGGEEPVTIRFAWWTNQLRTQRTLKVISMYETLNPNIKIEPEYAGWTQYWDKMATQVAANDLADIMQTSSNYMPQYAQKGLLAELEGIPALEVSAVDKSALGLGRLDGKLMGIPIGVNTYCMIYDEQMYDKAGIAVPSVSWTWEDFESDGLKLATALGHFGPDYLEIVDCLRIVIREHGGHLFSADGKRLGYEDDRILSDLIAMTVRLQKAGAMPGPELVALRDNPAEYLYAQGRAALVSIWSNMTGMIYETKKEVSRLMIFPGPNNDRGMYLNPSMYLAIAAGSEQKGEAAEFISYFITDAEATIALEADRGVPVTAAGREALRPLLSPQKQEEFAYIDLVGKHSSPIDPPEPAAAGEIEQIIMDIVVEAQFGNKTPEEAAAKFRKQAEEVLAR